MAKKILIVDDEPDILQLLEMRLRANGFEVVTGSSGEQALQKVKQGIQDAALRVR
jgi:DNA-binding response OmpR family regulator